MHAPVTAGTTGMIGAEPIRCHARRRCLPQHRAAQLHDTDALVDALRAGKVAAAGLDHFAGEWLATDHPLTACPMWC